MSHSDQLTFMPASDDFNMLKAVKDVQKWPII